jgi:hypothetical protein
MRFGENITIKLGNNEFLNHFDKNIVIQPKMPLKLII